MSSTYKFIREDLIGGSISQVDSVLPDLSSFQLQNTTFTKLAILVGLVAVVKGAYSALKLLRPRLSKPSKDMTTLTKRYGEKSWAIIGDVYRNESYALFLAKRGFNIILLGTKEDIEISRELIMSANPLVEVESCQVNWELDQLNEQFYQTLYTRFQYYDISFLITPRIKSLALQNFSTDSPYPVVAPVFLLVSTFLKKLKARAYRSGIIINSDFRSDKVEVGRSLQNGAVSAVETFGKTLEYEVRDYCDVVIAKGTESDAFDCLGVCKISQA